MTSFSSEDSGIAGLKTTIHEFIRARLEAKLAKLKPEEADKRAKLEAAHRPEAWLADAARRASQIQLASHILKPIHPDARGTNLHVVPPEPKQPGLVGTHSLGVERATDAVGNAAALDVYKFLTIEHAGRSLLELAVAKDPAFISALSDDAGLGSEWCEAFAAVTNSRTSPASDALAKQVYFPLPDGTYHLLAPLFPTSLVHAAYRVMREDRFGEAAKAARKARREGRASPHGYREYPNLAIRKFGGTKPQNISQLNSERHGENWLLPSLPPSWQMPEVRPPWGMESVFEGSFGRQRQVRRLTKELKAFLERVSHNNLSIRQHRAAIVAEICDAAHDYAARLRLLDPGWTADERCRLHEAERLWLDPLRVEDDEEFLKQRLRNDWPVKVAHRFGNWLNAALFSKKLPVGDNEQTEWKHEFGRELDLFREVLETDRDEP